MQLQRSRPSTENIQNETKPRPPTQSVAPRIRSSVCRKLSLVDRDPPSTVKLPVTQAESQPHKIRIEYLHEDQIQYLCDTIQIDNINSNPRSSIKQPVEQCQLPTISSQSNCIDSASPNISFDVKCELSKEERIHNSLKLPSERKKSQRISTLSKKLLFAILQEVQKELRTEQLKFQRNPLLLSVLNCIRSLEIYANSLIELKMSGNLKRNKAAVGMASSTNGAVAEDVSRKVLKQNDDLAESTTLEKDGTTANNLQSRRPQKSHRTPDNVRLMLVPESPEETNEKDNSKKCSSSCKTNLKCCLISYRL